MTTCDKLEVTRDDCEENKVTPRPFGKAAFCPQANTSWSQEDSLPWKCAFFFCLPLSPTDRTYVFGFLELSCQNIDQNITFFSLITSWSEEIRGRDEDMVLAFSLRSSIESRRERKHISPSMVWLVNHLKILSVHVCVTVKKEGRDCFVLLLCPFWVFGKLFYRNSHLTRYVPFCFFVFFKKKSCGNEILRRISVGEIPP